MPILRYVADADCSITNAFKPDLINSATFSNDGASDTLQTFVLWNQNGLETASFLNKQSRILLHFPINEIIADINAQTIPASAEYYLKLSNARHAETLPKDYILIATLLNKSFTEGSGQDQYNFTDLGSANWLSSSDNVLWTTPGGDLLSSTYSVQQFFSSGSEDFYVDISSMVRALISGTVQNNGFAVLFSSSYQNTTQSYYNKKFFSRTSEFFYLRPYIEARWNDCIEDDRINCFTSASNAGIENINTIYFYNYIRGVLKNIPSIETGSIYMSIYTNSSGQAPAFETFTGGYCKIGVYSCSFYTNLTGTIYDFWFSGSENYYNSSIEMKNFMDDSYSVDEEFVVNIKNLKQEYSIIEKPRLKLSITRKNWKPNYYLTYQEKQINEILENLYYKVDKLIDGYNVIPYGTGTVEFTKLSYNSEGNYFDLNMSLFEPNYMYKIKFLNIIDNHKKELPFSFKFLVK